jgi:hypothetical protein
MLPVGLRRLILKQRTRMPLPFMNVYLEVTQALIRVWVVR